MWSHSIDCVSGLSVEMLSPLLKTIYYNLQKPYPYCLVPDKCYCDCRDKQCHLLDASEDYNFK